MKTKLIATVLSLAIVTLLILAGPAQAFTIIISSIPDVLKGDDLVFSVDISDIDKQVDYAVLVIENTGASLDRIECTIEDDGSYECIRFKGSRNNPKPYDEVEITQTGDFGYGYTSGGDVSFDVIWHTGTDHQPGIYVAQVEVFTVNSPKVLSPEASFKLNTPGKSKK